MIWLISLFLLSGICNAEVIYDGETVKYSEGIGWDENGSTIKEAKKTPYSKPNHLRATIVNVNYWGAVSYIPNNWATKDFSTYQEIQFFSKSKKPLTLSIQLFDTEQKSSVKVMQSLATTYKKIVIPMNRFNGVDLKKITAIVFSTSESKTITHVVDIDNIELLGKIEPPPPTPTPTPTPTPPPTPTPTPTPTPIGCNDVLPDWKTCNNWDSKQYGLYKIYNNLWGTGSGACMWGKSESCWGATATYDDQGGWVKSYLQAWRGYHYNMQSSVTSGLPQSMEALKQVTALWDMTTPKAGRYMALWDIYFQKSSVVENNQGDANLMLFQYIWDRNGWLGSDSDIPPPAKTVTVGGLTWKYKYIPSESRVNNGPIIVMYAFPQNGIQLGVQSAKIDIKAIYDWAVVEKLFPEKLFLKGVQAGWEIIEANLTLDGGKFQTNDFRVSIADEIPAFP